MRVSRHAGKTGRGHLLWLWGLVIGHCTLIFMMSAQQDLAPPQFPSSDKVAHFFVYGVLGILWARAAQASWPHWTFRLLLLSTMLFTGLYGVTDEWHQLYVPGRFSDRQDALADVCGGTLGGLAYLVTVRWLAKRIETSLTPVG
jgi:VanZ family protein